MHVEPETTTPAALGPQAAVIVADDHALVRAGLRNLLGDMVRGAALLEAHDADSLLRAARTAPQARLAIVDLNMPGMERGLRLAELALSHPRLPVVVVSALTAPDVVRRTLAVPNVHAFVAKSAPPAELREAIWQALRGVKLPFSQPLSQVRRPDVMLTPRLEEIRGLLRQGMSNKAIAGALGLSEGTVKNYVSEIFKTLNVSNRTQAARFDPDTQ